MATRRTQVYKDLRANLEAVTTCGSALYKRALVNVGPPLEIHKTWETMRDASKTWGAIEVCGWRPERALEVLGDRAVGSYFIDAPLPLPLQCHGHTSVLGR